MIYPVKDGKITFTTYGKNQLIGTLKRDVNINCLKDPHVLTNCKDCPAFTACEMLNYINENYEKNKVLILKYERKENNG